MLPSAVTRVSLLAIFDSPSYLLFMASLEQRSCHLKTPMFSCSWLPTLSAHNVEHLWMMSGTSKKRRYIPVNVVYDKLEKGLFTTLLPFHALTICDTIS